MSFQINDENELAGLILKSFNKDEFLNNDKIKKIDEFGKDIFIKTVKELENLFSMKILKPYFWDNKNISFMAYL